MTIFAEEWRDCLRAQYMHVVRSSDQVTLRTLVGVLHQVGFTDDELRALYLEATLRADDLPDDFLPSLDSIAPELIVPPPVDPAVAPPVEAEAAAGTSFVAAAVEDASLPDAARADAGDAADPPDKADPPPPADAPQQLSFF